MLKPKSWKIFLQSNFSDNWHSLPPNIIFLFAFIIPWSTNFPLPWFIYIYVYISEKAMAPHSSTLAWKIPWAKEPGRLQSMGSQRVRHDWATSLSLFTFMHWRREMATHSSVLAWRIPGTGEPGGLLSMGSHRVGHDWSNLAAAAASNKMCVYVYTHTHNPPVYPFSKL